MSCWPTSTGSGASDLVSDRFAAEFTVVTAVDPLLAVLGSPVAEITLAVLVSVPSACGVTLIETLALPVLIRLPSEHETVPADCEQLPWVGVAEVNVTPGGSVSVRVMPVAVEGPALLTPTL